MKTALVPLTSLIIPDFESPGSKVDDDVLKRSIEADLKAGGLGIQQPLAVLQDGRRYIVARGLRRIRAAKALGITKVPIAIFPLKKGETPESYAPVLRVILDKRQDLLPSQRCTMIEQLKKQFGMTNLEVSQYLGVDQDTITNWLAIRHYVPEVVEAIDSGRLAQRAARVFDGMTEKGQRHIWKRHEKELTAEGAGRASRLAEHKALRAQYSPDDHPEFYRKPEVAARRLNRKKGARTKKAPRPSYTEDEKDRLMKSFNMREVELAAAKAELKTINRQLTAAIAPIAAIIRNEKLWKLVPERMKGQLERFAEVYI